MTFALAATWIGAASALSFDGVVHPTAPVLLQGVLAAYAERTQDAVVVWAPEAAGRIDLGRGAYFVDFLEARWTTDGASGALVSTASGPAGSASFVVWSSRIEATDVGLEIGAGARWVLSSGARSAAGLQVSGDAVCSLVPAASTSLNLTDDPAALFPSEAWKGSSSAVVAATCHASEVLASGSWVLTMTGTRILSRTQTARGPAMPDSFEAGLSSSRASAGSDRVEHRFARVSVWPTRPAGVVEFPGGDSVFLQLTQARLAGTLQIPASSGAMAWGNASFSNPDGRLRPEGTFTVEPASEGGLSIRGETLNWPEKLTLGLTVAAAAGLALRYAGLGVQVLFTRLTESRALTHPGRRSILDAVTANPGISVGGLARLLGKARPPVDYHVRVLARHRLLVRRRYGGTTALFPPDAIARADERRVQRLRHPSLQRLLRVVEEEQADATQARLASRMGLSQSRVSHLLLELEGLGLVLAVRAGGRRRYRLRDDASASPARVRVLD